MGEEGGVSKVEFKNILSFSIFCGYKGCGKEAIRVDIDEISGEVIVYCICGNKTVISEKEVLNKGLIERLIYYLNNGYTSGVDVFFFDHTSPFRKGLPYFCLECNCAYCEDHHRIQRFWKGIGWHEVIWMCPRNHSHSTTARI